MELEDLGYNSNLEVAIESLRSEGLRPARVSAVHKNNYLLMDGAGETFAELTGKFMYELDSGLSLPTVGDWVAARFFDENTLAIIHHVLPRSSLLKRRDPGKNLDYQLIAANIDIAFIMQSLDSNFNLNRLERYLVMVNEGRIEPVILLSKSDLVSRDEILKIKSDTERLDHKYRIYFFSNMSAEGLPEIESLLNPGKTYCLLGSSGVGKTMLLNNLLGDEKLRIREVREKDQKGRHTTTTRQLMILKNGSMIVDTPGMRELGNIAVEEGITITFDDIEAVAQNCRFKNCTHSNQEGCAVIEAVSTGEIDSKKYTNYLKMKKESEFYEMSYLEKRRRDKSLGKFYKQVMKEKRKK